jgi:hypothetical protein
MPFLESTVLDRDDPYPTRHRPAPNLGSPSQTLRHASTLRHTRARALARTPPGFVGALGRYGALSRLWRRMNCSTVPADFLKINSARLAEFAVRASLGWPRSESQRRGNEVRSGQVRSGQVRFIRPKSRTMRATSLRQLWPPSQGIVILESSSYFEYSKCHSRANHVQTSQRTTTMCHKH